MSALVMIASSTAGFFWPGAYAQEPALWAAQGVGQDAANAFLLGPALLVASAWLRRRSYAAGLVTLGLTGYVAYSYILYTFFIHFGPLFLSYVATLGLAVWAVGLAVAGLDPVRALRPPSSVAARAAGCLLILQGSAFAALWMADITRGLAQHAPPPSAVELGFIVNPVHVLDLAVVLPGFIAAGVLLLRRAPSGVVLAVPSLVFGTAMAVALIGMLISMRLRGLPAPTAQVAGMAAVAVVDALAAWRLLRGRRSD